MTDEEMNYHHQNHSDVFIHINIHAWVQWERKGCLFKFMKAGSVGGEPIVKPSLGTLFKAACSL